jgi:hypothetical protein
MGDMGDYWRDVKAARQERLNRRTPKQVERDNREREQTNRMFAAMDESRMNKYVERLENEGFEVKKFSPYHIRVNGVLDVWNGKDRTTTRSKSGEMHYGYSVMDMVHKYFHFQKQA